MVVSLYLDEQTAIVLRTFGTINDTVNRIIDAGMSGAFDIFDKPVAPPREECRRYEVSIANKEYISLISMYPDKSPKTSLRRLVTWFVDNELYVDLEWKISVDKNKRDSLLRRLDDVVAALRRNQLNFIMLDKKLFDNAITACENLGEKLHELQ